MKLREVTMGSITPLFLLLAMALNGGAWALKRHELRGAYEGHARTVAITLAEHLRGADAELLAEDQASPRVTQALTALERWGLIVRLQVWDPEGRPGWRWPNDTRMVPARENDREDWVGEFDAREGAWRAGAVVRGSDGTPRGWIEVDVDAAAYPAERESLKWTFLRHTLAVVVGAWILAGGLAWLMARDLRRVSESLKRIGSQRAPPEADLKVAELADLSESFMVLDAVLHEHEAKESIAEHLVSEMEVAQAWRNAHDAGCGAVAGNWQVEFRRAQTFSPHGWRGRVLSETRGAVWFGRLRSRGAWSDACRSAASECDIKPLAFLPREEFAAAWGGLARCYDWESGSLARWQGKVPRIEVFTWLDGTGHWNELTGESGRWLVHNLAERDAASAGRIVAAGMQRDASEIMDALSAVFEADAGQMVLLVCIGPQE